MYINHKAENNIKNKTFYKAVIHAFTGIYYCMFQERNIRIQLTVAIAVIITAANFNVSNTEWIAVLFSIALVLCMEMLNTAIEKLCDTVEQAYHPSIKIVKDVSAGAVLFASLISSTIGLIIFIPKIL